ncbi:hypothetical protein BVC80_35g5 [Macleaya cordata]|uniref:Uncharacterized protein n=1 Tax=Macleaya cordata TaxID=56857 RepID=A0A200QAP4_MACCD|nr:hypothetical protein BVC80_35g5 [Macleaya cordata]
MALALRALGIVIREGGSIHDLHLVTSTQSPDVVSAHVDNGKGKLPLVHDPITSQIVDLTLTSKGKSTDTQTAVLSPSGGNLHPVRIIMKLTGSTTITFLLLIWQPPLVNLLLSHVLNLAKEPDLLRSGHCLLPPVFCDSACCFFPTNRGLRTSQGLVNLTACVLTLMLLSPSPVLSLVPRRNCMLGLQKYKEGESQLHQASLALSEFVWTDVPIRPFTEDHTLASVIHSTTVHPSALRGMATQSVEASPFLADLDLPPPGFESLFAFHATLQQGQGSACSVSEDKGLHAMFKAAPSTTNCLSTSTVAPPDQQDRQGTFAQVILWRRYTQWTCEKLKETAKNIVTNKRRKGTHQRE